MKKTILLFFFLLQYGFAFTQNDSIDLFIKATMKQKDIPGLQLAIVKDGKIVKAQSYGIANLQNAVPVDNNTVFTINSMTKAFTGVAAMQLVEQGKLSLEAPVSKYLDDLPAAWQKLTIRQLFAHTSGLPDVMDSNGNLSICDNYKESWKQVQTMPMKFKAGEKFSYNQTGYVLLGKVINKLSGKPFADLFRDEQWKKAGLKNTIKAGFGDFHDIIVHSAQGYTHFRTGKLTNVTEVFPTPLRTAAGMNSTATDIAKWLLALQQGKLLKKKTSIEALWTPAKLNDGKPRGFGRMLNGYAIGWPVILRPAHPAVAPVGGGRSSLVVYPKDNLAIVMLTNLQGAFPERFSDEIAGFYYPEMKIANGFGFSPPMKLLIKTLERKGYAQVIKTAKKIKKQHKNFTFSEGEVNAWGYKLVGFKRKKDALEIFKLNVHLYPKSSNVYDSLGETYAILGNTNLAIKSYAQALKLNPDSKYIKKQLKKLRAKK